MTAHGNTDPHREMKTSKCKIKEPQLSLHFLNFIFIMIKLKKYYLSESLFGVQNSMLFTICIILYKYHHKKFKSIFFTLKINSGSMVYLATPTLLQIPTHAPVHSMSVNLSVSNFIQKNQIIFGFFHLLLYLWLTYAMIHSSIPFLLWLVICHCINILLGIHWLVMNWLVLSFGYYEQCGYDHS